MSDPWFHATPLPGPGERFELAGDEARHAAGARRRGEGDPVVLFDGEGGVARGVVEARMSGRGLVVRVSELEYVERPRPRLRLATALPKGDRQSTLFAMSTQVGVQSIQPIDCRRSLVAPGRGSSARFERIVIAACKQSRNPWRPTLEPSQPLSRAVRHLTQDGPCLLIHPGLASNASSEAIEVARAATKNDAASVSVLVGPEGGFTDEEVEDARARGALLASLGPTILRTETACVAALSIVASAVRAALNDS